MDDKPIFFAAAEVLGIECLEFFFLVCSFFLVMAVSYFANEQLLRQLDLFAEPDEGPQLMEPTLSGR